MRPLAVSEFIVPPKRSSRLNGHPSSPLPVGQSPPSRPENKLLSHVKRGQQALMARRRKVSLASTTGHVGFGATSCSIQTFGSQYSP